MADLVVAPDSLAVVIGWLKQQTELTALTAGRVASKLPSSKTFPAVRVSRLGGNETYGHNHWLHTTLMQVDCYAVAEGTAFNVARVVSALLAQRFNGVIIAGAHTCVVSKVEVGGIHQGYDPVDKDLPVAEFDVQFHLHPVSQ